MMADDDDVGVGIEFGVGAGGDVAHRHQEGIGQVGGLEFPRLADVEEEGCVLLRGGAELGEGLRSDLGVGEAGRRGGHGVKHIVTKGIAIPAPGLPGGEGSASKQL